MIRLEKLTKTYRHFKAVDAVDLHVHAGEIFAFLGPNGAGKTTINRILAGLLLPTSGRVWIHGLALDDHPLEIKRLIGFVPDRPFLYEKLTALEFLQFMGEVYQVKPTAITERSESLLREFGIWDFREHLIESFSHGMKQRLVMAASLLHQPKLLIVDEPMVGIDPSGIHRIRQIFLTQKKQGTTIFMSTHVLSIAQAICDRLAILHRGKIVALGTLDEVLHRKEGGGTDLENLFLTLTAEE